MLCIHAFLELIVSRLADTATITCFPEIVDNFHNADLIHEPESVRQCFESSIDQVSEFLSRVETTPGLSLTVELSRRVVDGFFNSNVGVYSKVSISGTIKSLERCYSLILDS